MKTAFLGVGNMAGAIISANGGKTLEWKDIILYDIFSEKLSRFEETGVFIASSVKEAVEIADCVLLSVKPQDYFTLLDQVKLADGYADKLYISIGAGIQTQTVEDYLSCTKVVRALPNTPMLIGEGVSAVCRNAKIPADEFSFVYSLFESAGSAFLIDEEEMNRIIGVTSSSPAYVFKFIEAIAKGAQKQGLDGDLYPIVCDVVIGAAKLLKESGRSAEEMIAMVASKGGTTERALSVLKERAFDEAVIDAMIACTLRADELGKTK